MLTHDLYARMSCALRGSIADFAAMGQAPYPKKTMLPWGANTRRILNTWDGVTHDYTRKRHVIYTEVMLPPNAPQEFADRNLLWTSVEWNETKANAQLARSIELVLPAELNHEQNIALVRNLVQRLFVDKSMCADVAFHDKDDGNPHAHILLTMRPLTAEGKWATRAGWSTSWMLMATASLPDRKAAGKHER